MTSGITCRLNSGCKMLLSVNQCLRNSFRNKHLLLCAELSRFKTSSFVVPLVRFTNITSNRTIFRETWTSNLTSRYQFMVPLGHNCYSKKKTSEVEGTEGEKKLGLYQRFKKMYKEYWYVLLPVHLITSTIWFGSFYYMAASGIDIPALLESMGAPEVVISNFKNSKAGNVVVAYTLYKLASPARYTVTLGGTTLSINYLKKRGLIKPVSQKMIKKMVENRQNALAGFKANCQDKMQVTKTEFNKSKEEVKQQCKEAKKYLSESVEGVRKGLEETTKGFKETVKTTSEDFRYIGKAISKSIKKEFRDKD